MYTIRAVSSTSAMEISGEGCGSIHFVRSRNERNMPPKAACSVHPCTAIAHHSGGSAGGSGRPQGARRDERSEQRGYRNCCPRQQLARRCLLPLRGSRHAGWSEGATAPSYIISLVEKFLKYCANRVFTAHRDPYQPSYATRDSPSRATL